MHLDLTLHRPRLGVYTLADRIYLTCQDNVFAVLHEGRQVHFLDIHMGIVGGIIYIVFGPQTRLAALVLRIADHIHLHRLEVHLRGIQIGFGTHLIGTHMQPLAGDQIARQVHTGIAVDRVGRDV